MIDFSSEEVVMRTQVLVSIIIILYSSIFVDGAYCIAVWLVHCEGALTSDMVKGDHPYKYNIDVHSLYLTVIM